MARTRPRSPAHRQYKIAPGIPPHCQSTIAPQFFLKKLKNSRKNSAHHRPTIVLDDSDRRSRANRFCCAAAQSSYTVMMSRTSASSYTRTMLRTHDRTISY